MSELPQLPLDCIVHILSQLASFETEDGEVAAQTLARCSQVNSIFREASSGGTLWEPHYRARYQHCIEDRETERKSIYGDNYKVLYAERRKLDKTALAIMDRIVEDRRGRTERATEIVRLGLDVWDALRLEAESLEGSLSVHSDGSEPEATATRHYWTRAIMEEITRGYGVQVWRRMRQNEVSFVEGYTSMSCFFGKTFKQVNDVLVDITHQARERMLKTGIPLTIKDANYDVRVVCTKLCEVMGDLGFGPVDARSFHNIDHQFPHSYLTSNRKSIPISLVHVFVAIARSLGVQASPVDFPFRVLVHVCQPWEDDDDDFYVDTFDRNNPILSAEDDIPRLLSRQGVSANRATDLISPCGAIPMVLRAGRNVMAALHSPRNTSASLARAAVIFTFSMHIQLSSRPDLVPQFVAGCEPLDCATFVSEDMVPAHPEGSQTRELLTLGIKEVLDREKAEAEVIHFRSLEESSVQHFVGLVFRHRLYNYIGSIFGWDPVCAASEDWIRDMNVDTLPRQRHQPFYQCFCNDGSIRYVAEDNIKPLLNVSEEMFGVFHRNISILPRYFTGIHMAHAGTTSRARFFLSPELLHSYPEDDDLGRTWVEQVESDLTG
ncbi:hypothetical protein PM082_003206 [Marasmius tenuissimus]|nr:hypothetical protein PM082_003206 [Marasmius tenuissimus]